MKCPICKRDISSSEDTFDFKGSIGLQYVYHCEDCDVSLFIHEKTVLGRGRGVLYIRYKGQLAFDKFNRKEFEKRAWNVS